MDWTDYVDECARYCYSDDTDGTYITPLLKDLHPTTCDWIESNELLCLSLTSADDDVRSLWRTDSEVNPCRLKHGWGA